MRVPSGLNIEAWRSYLLDYEDKQIVDFLEFGWPVSFNRSCPLVSTCEPHSSGRDYPESIQLYIDTELGHKAGADTGLNLTGAITENGHRAP